MRPTRINGVAESWGGGLARLHGLPCDGFGTLRELHGNNCVAFLSDLLMKEQAPLSQFDPLLASRYVEQVGATLAEPDLATRPPCFVHGDVHARNILVQDRRVVWLDWEACRRRLPEFDFAQLPFTTWRGADGLRDAMIAGYRATRGGPPPLSAALLHLMQLYWHVRFGLFLKDCRLPIDFAYFGTFQDHLDRARELVSAQPEDWTRSLAGKGTSP
ncbi:hypothetical protein AJ87_08130 [Rhizobium yanglingense]|nr:hypothetical protein AJ87_08130 [Rhizobium yanglingense]